MSTTIRVITEREELLSLEPAWSALLERSATNEPTLSPPWLLSWWRVFGAQDGRALRVLVFHEGNRLIGLVPLLARRCWYPPAIPFRRLELLASGEDESDEICSDYIGLLAESGAEETVVRGLCGALASGELGPWDELLLPAMNGESRLPMMLREALAKQRLGANIELSTAAPYVPLPARWDDYIGKLPGSRRYLVRRSLRDFERWAAGDAKIERVEGRESLEEGKRILMTLHGERWSKEGSSGVFSSSRFRAFHDALMPELLARGALDLWWVRVRGEPVAVSYNVVWNGKSYFYQSGRSLSVPRELRVGIVMHALGIQRAIDAGLREYDFLAGTSRYKMSMALATRPIVRLRVARPSVLEAMRVSADLAIEQAKALRNALRPLEAPSAVQQDDEQPPSSRVPSSAPPSSLSPSSMPPSSMPLSASFASPGRASRLVVPPSPPPPTSPSERP